MGFFSLSVRLLTGPPPRLRPADVDPELDSSCEACVVATNLTGRRLFM